MNRPEPGISIDADVTNPGQFFACCGLLEIAHRLWPGAEGWFEQRRFYVGHLSGSLDTIVSALQDSSLEAENAYGDEKTAPLRLSFDKERRIAPLLLDWWLDDEDVSARLKTWAGQQKVTTVARAMWHTSVTRVKVDETWLDRRLLAYDPDTTRKPVEPFYFDARRFAHPLDVGYSLDTQDAIVEGHPAVEFLALVGLQRFRPRRRENWSFEYHVWTSPLPSVVSAAVVCGAAPAPATEHYGFPILFRDDQKRYKAFGFAKPLGENT